MGMLDKAMVDKLKTAAQQAVEQAQLGMAQGQAKLTEFQLKRQADALLRDLGAAYYLAQRHGGSGEGVDSALASVDAHAAAHGPIDTAPSAKSWDFPAAASDPAAPPGGATEHPGTRRAEPPPTGTYSLDDL